MRRVSRAAGAKSETVDVEVNFQAGVERHDYYRLDERTYENNTDDFQITRR
jgi:hypothetical protein